MISANRLIKILPSARRHLADPIEPIGPILAPWPTSYKKSPLGIKLFPQLPSFLPVQLTAMSSMSSLFRERELVPMLTGSFFFFQTMLPLSIIVCYHWSKCLSLRSRMLQTFKIGMKRIWFLIYIPPKVPATKPLGRQNAKVREKILK